MESKSGGGGEGGRANEQRPKKLRREDNALHRLSMVIVNQVVVRRN